MGQLFAAIVVRELSEAPALTVNLQHRCISYEQASSVCGRHQRAVGNFVMLVGQNRPQPTTYIQQGLQALHITS